MRVSKTEVFDALSSMVRQLLQHKSLVLQRLLLQQHFVNALLDVAIESFGIGKEALHQGSPQGHVCPVQADQRVVVDIPMGCSRCLHTFLVLELGPPPALCISSGRGCRILTLQDDVEFVSFVFLGLLEELVYALRCHFQCLLVEVIDKEERPGFPCIAWRTRQLGINCSLPEQLKVGHGSRRLPTLQDDDDLHVGLAHEPCMDLH
mmetsp:Transcript_17122/g.36743  ORF Transcript_17122/g.36743 Transcript_17122/m.36743 type:complete len:206 (+) Transcript_17122:1001-1618(+)